MGKKGNLAEMVSKLNSVFRTLFTPGAVQAIQQNPELGKLLNEILEMSGMSPISYGRFKVAPLSGAPEPTATPSPAELPALAT